MGLLSAIAMEHAKALAAGVHLHGDNTESMHIGKLERSSKVFKTHAKQFAENCAMLTELTAEVGTVVVVGKGDPDTKGWAKGWLRSPGHRRNIERGDMTHCAVGVSLSKDGKVYFVQLFAQW